jgi:hypothetical protein
MSTIESNPLPNDMSIACCNACLLSSRMKVCHACSLNPGKLSLNEQERSTVDRKHLLKPIQIIKTL